jgi:cystathionine beta-lyase
VQLCNPHNPNGKVYETSELEALGEFCLRRNLLLCADEVHADLILDEDKKHVCVASLSPDIARMAITLQSPSKAFNIAGLNFAVAVIPDDNLRARFCHALAGKVIGHLNPFGLAAAEAAWSECGDWLSAVIKQLRTNRDQLANAIADMPNIHMKHLASTYLAWLNVSELGSSNPPTHFESAGIGMSAGADFGDSDYMRLNFGCSQALLEKMIHRLTVAQR